MNTTTTTASTATTDNTVPARVNFAEACMGYVASALSTLPDTDGVEDVRAHGLRIVSGTLLESLDEEDPAQVSGLLTESGVVLELIRRSLVADGDKAPARALPLIELARAELADALACGTGA